MPSTNKTQYLQLNQFIGTDKNKRVDYNADMLNIENTVKTTFKNLSFNNGTLTATKIDNSQLTLNIYQPISNDNRGLTTFNEIKQKALEKMQEFGIGSNAALNLDMNAYRPTGVFIINNGNSRINGKTTAYFNMQYDANYGIQLGLTEEEVPTANIRVKRNGVWNEWKRLVDEPRLDQILESKRARLDDIWAGV